MSTLAYSFSASPLPGPDQVGGKAHSLMTLFQAGFPVPDGFVLPVAYFEPWLVSLRTTAAWKDFRESDQAGLRRACDRLKLLIAGYVLSSEQKETLNEQLHRFTPNTLAVRSSSLEEDLASASFAGAYKTVLGVSRNQIEPALRAVFASCFEEGLLRYKRQRGFDPNAPRLAAVVQEQLPSDVAGAGYSKNPLTGDPDDAVFESNWGLGETVVRGRVSPDRFVVKKSSRLIVERRMGRKEQSLVLAEESGVRDCEDPRHAHWSLTDGQLQALIEALIAVERRFGQPIDIEWAFARGRLWLLQARPIPRPPTAARTAIPEPWK